MRPTLGMLYAKALRSSYRMRFARGRNRGGKISGVVAVITRDDLTGLNLISDRWSTISPWWLADRVRHVGEAGARGRGKPEIAEEALDLIKVDYEELPAVFDLLEATRARYCTPSATRPTPRTAI
jgi:CO/xanthine dehydrogenase Mo-binding subunit